jgi:Sortase domain
MAAPPRPTGLATAALVAGLALVLGGCTGAVDNREHPPPASATLPLRGTSHGEAGLTAASMAGEVGPAAAPAGAGAPGGRFGRAGAPGGRFGRAPMPTAAAGPRTGRFDVPGVPPRAPGFEVGDLPRRVGVPRAGVAPVRLVIPAIGVSTPLVRLGLEGDGGMEVPADFGRAGWFAEGPTPGQVGPSVIAGHVDSRTGPAVFYRLRELRPGQVVLVERADGRRLRFVVEQARSFPKDRFPTGAVFGPVPSAALRLITCGGDFDRARGSYRDNLVVFARLAGQVGTDTGNRG